jgi:NADH-quinone oxidoreductase subunit G
VGDGRNPLEKSPLISQERLRGGAGHVPDKDGRARRRGVPVASAYEKNGTVTNVCGEVQRLKAALKIMGTKPDLEIMGLGAVQTMPVNGRVEFQTRPDLVQSANDTLFTSGYLGRYSKTLNSVLEAPGKLYN